MRRFSAALLAAVLLLTAAGCGRQTDTADDGRLQVVCTLFPYYDFVRQIGGDAVDAVLLVPAGRETHSFEPTPLDVITMSRADVFIWNGGESELWVEDVLDAKKPVPKREEVSAMLRDCWRTAAEALLLRRGKPRPEPSCAEEARRLADRLTDRQLTGLESVLRQYAGECDYNVGVGHVLGGLAAKWEELL